MKEAFINKMIQIAERDPKLMFLTGDLGYGMVEPFVARFPDQFLNVGVAEQNMLGVATGLAMEGHTVFAYSIGNFCTFRCLEQIRNDASYHDANVKIVSMGGGFSYGGLGITHHATEDLAVLRAMPGVKVVAPSGNWEAAEATEAVAKTPGTIYLRLEKSIAPESQTPGEVFTLGKGRVIREGNDLALLCTGGILGEAMKAADALAEQGVGARVISLHTVKPLDTELVLRAARECGGIITVEEHSIDGGLGSAVAETLLDNGVPPKFFHRIALRAGFSSVVGSQAYLRAHYGLDAAAITAVAKDYLNRR